MTDKLLTVSEVASLLQVSETWVFQHASGRYLPVLPSIKMGKLVRFRSDDVEAFLQNTRRQSNRRQMTLH